MREALCISFSNCKKVRELFDGSYRKAEVFHAEQDCFKLAGCSIDFSRL